MGYMHAVFFITLGGVENFFTFNGHFIYKHVLWPWLSLGLARTQRHGASLNTSFAWVRSDSAYRGGAGSYLVPW